MESTGGPLTVFLRLGRYLDNVVDQLVAVLPASALDSKGLHSARRYEAYPCTSASMRASQTASRSSSQFFLKQSWSQKYDPLMPSLILQLKTPSGRLRSQRDSWTHFLQLGHSSREAGFSLHPAQVAMMLSMGYKTAG